ncbi:topoisomerase DNA-binding C4 zinc finger domain-containing protein [Variovorax robiniae]|uniref:topoisomerase DNA-binding C4 zinc finger domain-containing protein n=1 Tax=Variovorax robiniae TaxID=1836199 RepID=UPI003BF5BBDB
MSSRKADSRSPRPDIQHVSNRWRSSRRSSQASRQVPARTRGAGRRGLQDAGLPRAGGFVVTSGKFSGDAQDFAQGRNVKLVDGARLFALVRQAKSSLSAPREPEPENRPQPEWMPAPQPSCPSCGAEMIKRTAKKRKNAGQNFWGCATYPTCRGVRATGEIGLAAGGCSRSSGKQSANSR